MISGEAGEAFSRGTGVASRRSWRRAVTRPRKKNSELAIAPVAARILEARGEKVILDADLAAIYGVQTRVLNQAVKRNPERFPQDFAFRLTLKEAEALGRSRSQAVTMKRGQNVKYQPWAFTEHGAIMAASILNSPKAVEMSVYVVRAFVRLRDFARTHAEVARQLAALERRVTGHDEELKQVLSALRLLLEPPVRHRRPIGFGSKGLAPQPPGSRGERTRLRQRVE
jgi:hypothetical protein